MIQSLSVLSRHLLQFKDKLYYLYLKTWSITVVYMECMKILYIYTILFYCFLNRINCVVIPCYFCKIDECSGLFFFQQIVLYYSVLKKHWKKTLLFHQITYWIGNLMKLMPSWLLLQYAFIHNECKTEMFVFGRNGSNVFQFTYHI